jgi:hypothetical protein
VSLVSKTTAVASAAATFVLVIVFGIVGYAFDIPRHPNTTLRGVGAALLAMIAGGFVARVALAVESPKRT